MYKISNQNIRRFLFLFLSLELLSFIGWSWPGFGLATFIIISAATLALTIRRLEYGLLIVLGELLIGSLGHLFYLPYSGGEVPIRIVLWSIVLAVYLVRFAWQLFKQGKQSLYYRRLKDFSGSPWFILLFFFVLAGLVSGLAGQSGLKIVISDFNAWLYFALIGPASAVYQGREDGQLSRLADLFIAGAVWLGLKTLFLLFIFTHDSSLAPVIYLWLRQTLVGEMTPTLSGWPRIFIQGQIYCGLAYLMMFWRSAVLSGKEFFGRRNLLIMLAAGVYWSSLLISFSRSFWVALAAALFLSGLAVWRFLSFPHLARAAMGALVSAIAGVAIIYLVAAFPYVRSSQTDFRDSFLQRVSSGNEAALASRWSLLPVLVKEITRQPLLGQGFGATVTYISHDPRVLESNPSGEYETYAFEWGYLDIWLKIGLLGLAAYLILLAKLFWDSWTRGYQEKDRMLFGLGAGLLFLAVTHAFTPYLNHPLGIGFLVISSCLIWRDRVY